MIIVRSPLRISFAGGGTDLPSYYRTGFGAVCSMAINKYVYVTVNNLAAYFPHRFRVAYSQTELTQDVLSIKHPIVREVLKDQHISGGIDINVMADIPAGTGMGSSSAFSVTLIHALHAFQNRMISKEDLAKLACDLEINKLKEPIGKQDQYASAIGGLNLIRFNANETVSTEPVPLSSDRKQELNDHLALFYLGGNRQASQILKSQDSNIDANRTYLDQMRSQAIEAAKVIASNTTLNPLGELLNEGWKLKRSLASGISNTEVDEIISAGLNSGARGAKLLGAGGTGFILFFVQPSEKAALKRTLSKLPTVDFEMDQMGSTLLYYGN